MENIMLTSGNEKLNQSSQLADVLARLDNLETVIQNNESQQEDFKIMAKITKVGKYSKFSIARFLQIPSGALHEEHAHCTLGRRRSKISHSKGGWVNLVHG